MTYSFTTRLYCGVLICLCTQRVLAKVQVVTTTPGYADIVRQIGKDYVVAEAVMRGPENVHNVSPTPAQMMKLKKADLWIHSGLDAEPWAPLLVKGARNEKLLPGQSGDVDVSRGIALKEVPGRGGLTRALGDIHMYGNTHFGLDPLNGVIIARTITDALKRVDAANEALYESGFQEYSQRLRDLATRLTEEMKPFSGVPVVTYHRSWPYFLDRFGLRSIGEVEPKPGVTPGPQHLQSCIDTMKSANCKIVIVETYNSKKDADFVANHVGGKAVVLAQEVGSIPEVDTYEKMFEHNISVLIKAFKEVGVTGSDDSAAKPAPSAATKP